MKLQISKQNNCIVIYRFNSVRSVIITATSMTLAISWDVAPWSGRFWPTFHELDGDSKFLRNVVQYVPNYTVRFPGQHCSVANIGFYVSVTLSSVGRVPYPRRQETRTVAKQWKHGKFLKLVQHWHGVRSVQQWRKDTSASMTADWNRVQ